MMKRIIALLMAAALLFCICACEKEKPGAPSNEDETVETGDSFDYFKTDVKTNEIETPYGTLNYPAEWLGKVDVTTAEDGDSFRVIFTALLGEVSAPLYDIVFGACEEGFKLGELPFEGESVEVFCADYTLEGEEMISEEFAEEYAVMCEDLNVIISNLVYQNGMTVN